MRNQKKKQEKDAKGMSTSQQEKNLEQEEQVMLLQYLKNEQPMFPTTITRLERYARLIYTEVSKSLTLVLEKQLSVEATLRGDIGLASKSNNL